MVMKCKIMKFGGSCLKNAEAFERIIEITKIYSESRKVYVASAFKGITDMLLNTAENVKNAIFVDRNITLIEKKHLDIIEEIFGQDTQHYNKCRKWLDKKLGEVEECLADIEEFGLEPYYRDYIASFGEILSTYILNQYLLSKGFNSVYISSYNLLITNNEYTNAYPLYDLTNARVKRQVIPLLENPKENTICCITGFIGRNKIGYTTTFGRGGSDYTATILARSIDEVSSNLDIKVIMWKDVDGLLTIDPKYVPESVLIKNLDYMEAKRIANLGAKILHPKCLEAIENRNIPLEIRNFDNPLEKENFTTISGRTDKDSIKGISTIDEATIITITSGSMVGVPGVLAKIFSVMGKHNISVTFVSQSSSEVSTSFVVRGEDGERALSILKKNEEFSEFYKISSEQIAIINITGKKVLDNETKSRIFKALAKKNVKVTSVAQSHKGVNLSLIVQKDKLLDGITLIHDALCEDFDTFKCIDLRK
ncbi:MAG: aspartate kinase [Promethearchaeota archaeon]|nr:MAG: aspartate kinase [Candidatus Lokiarchaeota archaeon]